MNTTGKGLLKSGDIGQSYGENNNCTFKWTTE